MSEVLAELDISAFCDSDQKYRSWLRAPFVMDGVRFATDARVLVALPTDEPSTEFEEKKNPPKLVMSHYRNAIQTACDTPLPATFPDCPLCGQKGTITYIQCPACNGTRTVTCRRCDCDSDCHICHGTGRWKYGDVTIDQECFEDLCPIELVGKQFSRKRINLIASLPGSLMYGFHEQMLVVKATDGIVAILMPIERD